MRLLGQTATLATFRWDLAYLLAQLLGDERPGVAELAAPLQEVRKEIDTQRAAMEQAEDASIVAGALLTKKDKRRDAILIEAGGVARAQDKEVYATLFPTRSPSHTARLGIAEESAEVKRVLGEIAKLPGDHPVRVAYETGLASAESSVLAAGAHSDDAETSLALQRSELVRFKLRVDQARLTAHGALLVLLKSKAEADAFFRPISSAPGEEAKKSAPGAPGAPDAGAPEAPAVPVTPPAGG